MARISRSLWVMSMTVAPRSRSTEHLELGDRPPGVSTRWLVEDQDAGTAIERLQDLDRCCRPTGRSSTFSLRP